MGYLFKPSELVSILESLGTVGPSVSLEDGVKVFPCGVQCEMLLGRAKYRGNVRFVHVSTKKRWVTVDFEWICIWSDEFKRWSKVGSLISNEIPYHKHYFQPDEDRVKLKNILKGLSIRFFRMDDYSHIIETDSGFVSRWYLPKMALFRMITIAMLAKK